MFEYKNESVGSQKINGEDVYFWNIHFRGEVLSDYYLDQHGLPWSIKSGSLKRMSTNVGGNSPYPKVGLSLNCKKKTIEIHRLVCETFHEIPIPTGVTEQEWNDCADSIKDHFAHYWQVNHIDHDHENFHPDNLEWVSGKDNVIKYHEHRLSQAA